MIKCFLVHGTLKYIPPPKTFSCFYASEFIGKVKSFNASPFDSCAKACGYVGGIDTPKTKLFMLATLIFSFYPFTLIRDPKSKVLPKGNVENGWENCFLLLTVEDTRQR